MGLSFATNTVSVNTQTAYRKGEYFREELSLDNSSGPVWQSVTVSATGQSSVTGNQFVPKSQEQFGYDADGNLTSDGHWNYTWDAENRLIFMETLSTVPDVAALRLIFEYDYKGRRIQKTTCIKDALGDWLKSKRVKFIYDDWNLVAILDPYSSLLSSFVWGLDLSGSLQGAGGVGGLLEVSCSGTQTTNCFVAFDGNGNVAALADAASTNILAQYEYGPFGEVIRATGPMAKVNPFRFSTKYQDDESDLLYYGYRYYNASTGRWLSRDPMDEDGGPNLYAFLDGDPLSQIDAVGQKKAPKPETQTVLQATWTFKVTKTPAPKNPGPYGGMTTWGSFPDPGLKVKACECGGAGKSCGCGGAHLVSSATTTDVSYWVTKRKYEQEELSNVAIIRVGWYDLGGLLNSLGACVSRPCAECWLELGQVYSQEENAYVHLQLLQADMSRGIDRHHQINEYQHLLDSLVQQARTVKAKCDGICNSDE